MTTHTLTLRTFLLHKCHLDGLVFWREAPGNNTQVEVRAYSKYGRMLVEGLVKREALKFFDT